MSNDHPIRYLLEVAFTRNVSRETITDLAEQSVLTKANHLPVYRNYKSQLTFEYPDEEGRTGAVRRIIENTNGRDVFVTLHKTYVEPEE